MKISDIISNELGGRWYTIPGFEDADKPPQVKIRQISPEKRRELVKKCTVKDRRLNGKVNEHLDLRKMNEEFLDHLVEEFRNIEDDDGPLAPTRENKLYLDNNWEKFSSLWLTVLNKNTDFEVDIEQAELEN